MTRKLKLDADGLRYKTNWPRLPAADQQTLREYLSWYYVAAESAADQARDQARGSPEPQFSLATENYWRTVCKAIRWLMYHIEHRQRYLECKLALAEGRLKGPAIGPDTSSSPAASESLSTPTAEPAAADPASKPHTGRSKTHSRKRTRGA